MSLKLFVALLLSASAWAQPAATNFAISGVPKKAVCKSTNYEASGAPRVVELCLIQGMFSPDIYEIKINRKIVIKGTDDQTTAGIQGKDENKTWSLKCLPINAKPNITADQLKALEPLYPESKIAEVVDLAKGAMTPMEISRRCTLLDEEQKVMSVTVLF